MSCEKTGPYPLKREPTPEQQEHEKSLAHLADQNMEARKSLVERVARDRHFSHVHELDGIKSDEFPGLLEQAIEDYASGKFFLEELSLFFEVDPRLSTTVYALRQQWIEDYDLKTVPEFMLLDQIMLAYFQAIRLNKEVAKMLSLTEESLYMYDTPMAKLQSYRRIDNKFDHFVAKEHIKQLQDSLLPFIERFNQMFLRNLRALRELKEHPININIGQAGQVNLAEQQVNIQPKKASPRKSHGSRKKIISRKRGS